jgi:hypothetical protein
MGSGQPLSQDQTHAKQIPHREIYRRALRASMQMKMPQTAKPKKLAELFRIAGTLPNIGGLLRSAQFGHQD